MTGIIDGRLDSWALWPRALNAGEIGARYDLGLNQADPAPDPASVSLYVGFEDAYGSMVSDQSLAGHQGTIINHGTPRVAGVISGGHALRLNHDQLVDAGWPAPDFWNGVTPAGMSERDNGTNHPIPGGNNSAYNVMGDGSSVARYHGWKRPNFEAEIAEGGTTGFFYTKAAKSVPLVRWLDEESMSYDVYSDEDFALGRFPGLGTYRVLIFHGHVSSHGSRCAGKFELYRNGQPGWRAFRCCDFDS